MDIEADICIVAEGSYPFASSGVSQWVHQLINEHKERTFHILTLMPPNPDLTMHYQFPKNVVGHTVWIVQDLPEGKGKTPKGMWDVIKPVLKGAMSSKDYENFEPMLKLFAEHRKILGREILSESEESFENLIQLYEEIIPAGPFKAYFSSVFTLARSFYSIILPELPKAKMFHAMCTGYAGFVTYRAKMERGVPCMVTEQGIYTNERRIEIAMADWIVEMGSLDLALEEKKKTLKDFWLNAFFSFAHACYSSCDEILSTYDGNQDIQLEGGADPSKVRTIVHGIKREKRLGSQAPRRPHPPTVAFVGRVVPIKDVKTFIRACSIVKKHLPEVRFYILGSTAEDPDYALQCQELIHSLGMENDLKLSGSVDLEEYFQEIDLIVLTSLSEAQPLVILEAGALGIPAVATNVGGCEQLLQGATEEMPSLGQGGIITPLLNPAATADAILRLMSDKKLYKSCSQALAERINKYYIFEDEHAAYRALYSKHLQQKKRS